MADSPGTEGAILPHGKMELVFHFITSKVKQVLLDELLPGPNDLSHSVGF